MSFIVTIFKNIKETQTPFHRDVQIVLSRIKNGSSKDLVKKIRSERNKTDRNELKKNLPAVCFSGTFTKRTDKSISDHSGLICLDFDGYASKKELLQDKENFTKDKFVYSAFVSPSGNGLKVLVKIPADPENHVNFFNSLAKHFDSDYFDKMCKNVSRVCYESYDPLLYLNENSSIWDKIEDHEYTEVIKGVDPVTIPITDENKIVEILVKWWVKKYPMVEGQRNQNVFVLAMALNDYGVNRSLASYILNQYSTENFTLREIERTIESAYSNKQNFGTKYYEDEDVINNIKTKLRRGLSKKEIRYQLEESGLGSDVVSSVVDRVEKEGSLLTFWTKSDKGVIKIVHILFKQYLEENGFNKFCPEGGKNYVFVKVTNNLIDHTSEKEIKDFILNKLSELDDLSIYNYFADNVRYFREEFLTLLSTIDIYFIEDTIDTSYLYYKNCAVKITKDSIEKIDYIDLGGYVWKDHVIDRKFDICDFDQSDYKTFISRISANDDARIKTLESTIGFLMHGYKNLSYCPAVILNDEIISDNPEGGTGKGIFMYALSQMKKLVMIDGKAFNFERSFPYQTVSADTQVLCFDDVKKHFDFERLFSVVTEGMTLEKKNRDAIKIPFSKSPKISITTNYAIKGSGNSFARRKWEVELHQHYNKNYTPLDEFKKLFFDEWTDDDWCLFDNYMVSCLKDYLSTGLIKSESVNLDVRKLSAETSHEFIEFCGLVDGYPRNSLLQFNKVLNMNSIYYEFIENHSDQSYKSKMSKFKFYKWLVAYGTYITGTAPTPYKTAVGKVFVIEVKN
jgi:hypothetical protein